MDNLIKWNKIVLSCFYLKKKKNSKGLDIMILATSSAWTMQSNPDFKGSRNCHICPVLYA